MLTVYTIVSNIASYSWLKENNWSYLVAQLLLSVYKSQLKQILHKFHCRKNDEKWCSRTYCVSPLQILKTTFKKKVIANNINILHEFRFMFYMFLLLLQRWPSKPGSQFLHPPSFLSHVSLFKQFPLHSCMHPTPNVPFLHAGFIKTFWDVCLI